MVSRKSVNLELTLFEFQTISIRRKCLWVKWGGTNERYCISFCNGEFDGGNFLDESGPGERPGYRIINRQ